MWQIAVSQLITFAKEITFYRNFVRPSFCLLVTSC